MVSSLSQNKAPTQRAHGAAAALHEGMRRLG
jgi:hypothetical protein